MKKIKSLLLRVYHVKALKYIVVTLIGILVIGFIDENSIWHHIVNRQRISHKLLRICISCCNTKRFIDKIIT